MPNVMITITSHDMCDSFVVNTNNFDAELNRIYKSASKNRDRTHFMEGYPEESPSWKSEPLPCMVDEMITINCNL